MEDAAKWLARLVASSGYRVVLSSHLGLEDFVCCCEFESQGDCSFQFVYVQGGVPVAIPSAIFAVTLNTDRGQIIAQDFEKDNLFLWQGKGILYRVEKLYNIA